MDFSIAETIGSQSDFYTRLWASGQAGDDVTLHVLHDKKVNTNH